jgi:hypothetical protein
MRIQKIFLKFVGVFTPILSALCLIAGLRYFIFIPRMWMRGSICFVTAIAACVFGYAIYFILKNSIETKD